MTAVKLNQYLEMLAKLMELAAKDANEKEVEGLKKAAEIIRDNKMKV